jgi:hypothetical protein
MATGQRNVIDAVNVTIDESSSCALLDTDDDVCVLGLHTCGDLATTMLRMYVRCVLADFIAK